MVKKATVEHQPCTFGFVALLVSFLKPFFLVSFRLNFVFLNNVLCIRKGPYFDKQS